MSATPAAFKSSIASVSGVWPGVTQQFWRPCKSLVSIWLNCFKGDGSTLSATGKGKLFGKTICIPVSSALPSWIPLKT